MLSTPLLIGFVLGVILVGVFLNWLKQSSSKEEEGEEFEIVVYEGESNGPKKNLYISHEVQEDVSIQFRFLKNLKQEAKILIPSWENKFRKEKVQDAIKELYYRT